LRHVQFVIADLPGGMLGETLGNTVTIDSNAAGYGWSLGAHVAPNKVDLLTVVSHELGNELGLPELDARTHPGNVMDATLPTGVGPRPTATSGYAADASALGVRWLEQTWRGR